MELTERSVPSESFVSLLNIAGKRGQQRARQRDRENERTRERERGLVKGPAKWPGTGEKDITAHLRAN